MADEYSSRQSQMPHAREKDEEIGNLRQKLRDKEVEHAMERENLKKQLDEALKKGMVLSLL